MAAAALTPEVRDQLVPLAVGYVGEQRLGVELAWLDSRWSVLHSVPVESGGADGDHLLFSPAGVFTVKASLRTCEVAVQCAVSSCHGGGSLGR